jgi:hypothetical protein
MAFGISGTHEPLNHAVLAQAKPVNGPCSIEHPCNEQLARPGTHACTHHAGTPDLTEEAHEGTSPLYFAIVDERVDVVIGRDAL